MKLYEMINVQLSSNKMIALTRKHSRGQKTRKEVEMAGELTQKLNTTRYAFTILGIVYMLLPSSPRLYTHSAA